ncbi:UvrB/UvrC motif-containing protein [Chlamydiifrater volucris]|uniref:UvrB/UvrC motif-containing protein n=1 Tax=Chlamydiifrater volucris TaxID=2681470 RepID=UPI0032B26B39
MDTGAANPPKCYLCQNTATRCFTIVDKEKTVRSYVCADCPSPGHYRTHQLQSQENRDSPKIHLECGNCGTTWNQNAQKLLMGCPQCYENFKSALTARFTKTMSPFFQKEHLETLHPGRRPGQAFITSPMIKLIALNEALKDTLEKEDYEQAALLRDQINQIKNQNSHE